MTAADFAAAGSRRGLHAVILDADSTCIHSGAVYLYSASDLEALLLRNRCLLEQNGWPDDCEAFVARIAAEWLQPDHPIAPVIHAAFGD
jgi:hypothetical protein